MRPETKLCIVASICLAQLISCKKDNSNLNTPAHAMSAENVVTDSAITDPTLMNGLVAWYTFNGDALDHSGHNNNVILNSATLATGKAGVIKTAYKFDGVSSYMQVANSASLNLSKISIYALVKPKGFYQGKCHGNRIISKGYNDYDQGRIDLGFDDAAYYNYTGCDMPVQSKYQNFYGSYGDGVNATGAKDVKEFIKTEQWYNIVYTYDGVYSKLFVNGALVSRIEQSTTFNSNSNPLFIGRNQDPNYPYYFNGVIDEIRIYKRALNRTEVQALNK